MTEEAHAHEIVIIKRHGGHEDGHHGGVWKIAFADFMTAMMAFFLVMWLVSANDKTKATIAKYFNPVELVDSTPQPPGLNDTKKGDPSVSRETKKSPDAVGKEAKAEAKPVAGPGAADTPTGEAAEAGNKDEAELARDPYAVLAEIANKANKEAPEKSKEKAIEEAQRGVGAVGHQGGEAFRDPFEPLQAGSTEAPVAEAAHPTPPAAEHAAAPPPPSHAVDPAAAPTAAPAAPPPADAAHAGAPPAAAAAAAAPAEGKDAPPADDTPLPAAALRAKLAALGKAEAGGAPAEAGPKMEVKQTAEGLLISLTDSVDFSMFPSSSARPAAKMVTLVEKIGLMLKSQKGSITVRGFTDSRPFKSDTYDNWRLSTARAHMAHYMLVQGGVGDSRIDRVEGYADRRPRNPTNPEAAENRRIEILLRDNTP